MVEKMKQLLAGNSENHMLPFFWQHGEDEATLREYMEVIEGSGCRAVCVESRPHPDFCGEKWLEDMGVILDEARKRDMKIWILDDSHFPTGFANGAVKATPLELHRQSICASRLDLEGAAGEVTLDIYGNFPPEFHPVGMEAYILPYMLKDAPHYEDDEILSVVAVNHETGEEMALEVPEAGGKCGLKMPKSGDASGLKTPETGKESGSMAAGTGDASGLKAPEGRKESGLMAAELGEKPNSQRRIRRMQERSLLWRRLTGKSQT